MADKYDPYREALVLETRTVFPEELDDLSDEEKARIAQALHDDPQSCSQLQYERLHTGFCRIITVTPDDVARVSANA